MELSMSSKLGDIMDDGPIAALFEQHFPGVLDDPNMQNGKGLKIATFVRFPEASKKGITKEKMEAFIKEANAL